jgi:hypothetical protein
MSVTNNHGLDIIFEVTDSKPSIPELNSIIQSGLVRRALPPAQLVPQVACTSYG